ncbi:MAG TPA: hypothetical protein EYN06_04300 [Myxococcales bacterium]|nr:hypothetical protein [Myxococcales bacterium]HIN85681.1 hypothetical protein [Myxococcales bacterium]
MNWTEDMGGIVIALAMLVTMTFCTLNCSEEFRCTNDYDCPSAEVCNPNSGACQAFECENDGDCLDPTQRCQSNTCLDFKGS